MQTQNEYEQMCETVYKTARRASMAVLIPSGRRAQGLQLVADRAFTHRRAGAGLVVSPS